jgi:anti-sigma regulatory factor (Ser/Thr protein kinase)
MHSPLRIRARTLCDAPVLSSAARRFAREAGFDSRACTEIGIVVSELATNSVRHAGGSGEVSLSFAGGILEVVSVDHGPGTAFAVASALSSDPPSLRGLSSGGLGCGLGAVRRLMDQVECGPRAGGGLWLRAIRHRVARSGST